MSIHPERSPTLRCIHGISFALKYGLAYYMETEENLRPVERLMARRSGPHGEWRDLCVAVDGQVIREDILKDWDQQQLDYVRSTWEKRAKSQ